MSDKTNSDGVTYAEWINALDRILVGFCGLTHSDLPDFNSWDRWHECADVAEVADELLEDEGFPFEDGAR